MARYNCTIGNLLAGELFRSHSEHPSLWRMISRDLGGVRVRCENDSRTFVAPHRQRVWSLEKANSA